MTNGTGPVLGEAQDALPGPDVPGDSQERSYISADSWAATALLTR